MKRIIKVIIIISTIISMMNITLLNMVAEPDSVEEKLHLLVVFSDESIHRMNEKRLDALENAFESYGLTDGVNQKIQLDLEFLDIGFMSDPLFYETYLSLLVDKWNQHKQYDCIIAYDYEALDFIDAFLMANTVPVIFSGIYDQEKAESYNNIDGVTGFYDRINVLGTVNLAEQMDSTSGDIYVITDHSDMSAYYLKYISEVLEANDRYHIYEINFTELTMSDYLNKLELINPNDTVLLVSARIDYDLVSYDYYNSLEIIAKHSKAPIYSFWDIGIGNGVTGGEVSDIQMDASKIVELLDKATQDTTAFNKQKVSESTWYNTIIDYNYIEKHGININKLPDNLELVNKPKYYNEKSTIIVVVILVAVVTMLFISIVGLFYKIISERRKAILAVKTKSEFLAKMSHEIRTPTNAIIGYTQLLKQFNYGPEDIRRKVDMIEASSNALLNKINDILDYSM
ncbi:MAG: hypothetical protein PF505_12585, partial [Vallitaleaceae bacterium]|nr:hypothetical protein [Vallitaleaceae bacterium]